MDNLIAAIKEIGGFTAIGVLIDLGMYTSEKAKLKALLEDWWLQFTDVKWSNFGRAEAELAVQILDRWAGPRFWSWKRWRFATVVTLLVCVFAITWTAVRIGLDASFNAGAIGILLWLLPLSIVALALSLSFTRFIAVRAAQLCKDRLSSVTVFIALLGLHVLLLLFWSALVLILERWIIGLLSDGVMLMLGARATTLPLESYWHDSLYILSETMPQSVRAPWPKSWRYTFSLHQDIRETADVMGMSFKVAMDFVANGLRIVFALVFLSSFMFRPLIQAPVSRVWYGAINSDKPTFTMLFSAVGAIIAAGQALAK